MSIVFCLSSFTIPITYSLTHPAHTAHSLRVPCWLLLSSTQRLIVRASIRNKSTVIQISQSLNCDLFLLFYKTNSLHTKVKITKEIAPCFMLVTLLLLKEAEWSFRNKGYRVKGVYVEVKPYPVRFWKKNGHKHRRLLV